MATVELASPLSVTTPLAAGVLRLLEFKGSEGISRLFSFQLRLRADHARTGMEPVSFDRLLGQKIRVELATPTGSPRFFHGLCSTVYQGESDEFAADYRMELVPEVWLLTKRVQSRIFQQESVPSVLRKVFQGLRVDFRVEESKYRPRDYLVQYRESDMHFASRIMEEEGIYYFFQHVEKEHLMVISDAPLTHPSVQDPSEVLYQNVEGALLTEDRVYDWEKAQELCSGKYTLRDYCFERNDARFEVSQSLLTSVRVGSVDHALPIAGNAGLEIYDYPGEFAQRFDGIAPGGDLRGGSDPVHVDHIDQDGQRTVKIRMEQETVSAVLIRGGSNCRHFLPGHVFSLATLRDDRKAQLLRPDGGYLLLTLQHCARAGDNRSGGSESFIYYNSFTCIPERMPFRPPRTTSKPVIQGTQTAVVVGSGAKAEEISTDKHGRVKVQFHWDRQGKKSASSCWVRVGTPWAGKQWGMIHIPRIGQEVIVAFEEGDPDQPIIIGSVYNAEMVPPFLNEGDKPKHPTQSGIKTCSSPSGDASKNFNALCFEDKKDSEDILFHAEKDFHREVENNDSLKVGFEKKDQGNQTIEVFNNQTLKVGCDDASDGSQTISIHKDRSVTIDKGNDTLEVKEKDCMVKVDKGKHTLQVKDDRTVVVDQGKDTHQIKQGDRVVKIDMGKDSLTISQGDQKIKLDMGKIETEAMQSIEIKVGQSSIKLEQSGITIKGLQVKIEADIEAKMKGALAGVEADGKATLKGGITMIN